MLARSCHRVSLTTRGPAFRHLRSRHPPPRHAPDPSCPPRRPPGGSCASLLPPPRHPPVPIFPCQDLLRAKKMLTLGVLLPSLILIFSVDSISSHFRGKCVDTRGLDAIPAPQASQSEGRRARSGASSTPRSSTVGVVARAQSALPGLSRAGANSSSSFAPRATGTATSLAGCISLEQGRSSRRRMRHRTRESSDTKRTN